MEPMEIHALFGREKFPVRVALRDGRSYEIPAREFAVVGVTFLDIGYQLPNAAEGIWGPTTRIQNKDIRTIESLAAPASTPN
jgi:hypothetical protein